MQLGITTFLPIVSSRIDAGSIVLHYYPVQRQKSPARMSRAHLVANFQLAELATRLSCSFSGPVALRPHLTMGLPR
jgi:hypothetical protein